MEAANNEIRIGELTLRFLVDEIQSAGSLVVFDFALPPNARVSAPPHLHREVDEVVYGLEGMLTTRRDGETHEIGPGDSLFIPRGAVHHHENRGDTPARGLTVMTPGTIGRSYFVEMAAAVGGPGRPDPARLKDIMLRYGLVPA